MCHERMARLSDAAIERARMRDLTEPPVEPLSQPVVEEPDDEPAPSPDERRVAVSQR